MPIEFRNVKLAPLTEFRAVAPSGVIIGVLGEKGSGVTELLKLAAGAAQPEQGEVVAGPQRRYVALGEALNLAPADVIAIDQALATQDAVVRARTLTGLDRLRRSGTTVFLASHEGGLLEALCDEVWWIDAGEMAAKGDPACGREGAKLGREHPAAAGAVVPARRWARRNYLAGNAGRRP